MKLFLLIYDPQLRALVSIEEFKPGRYAEASGRLFQAEDAQPDMEVVLLEASSIDDLRRTHRRYFETLTSFLQPA